MTDEQRRMRRESGMLIIGVVIGGLFGFIGNLWTGYFIEWIKSIKPDFDWSLTLIVTTILFIIMIAFLVWWANKRLQK